MPPIRPTEPTSLDDLQILLTDDGSRTLSDIKLGETYHSGCGALAESWFVYAVNSGMVERIRTRSENGDASPLRVLEVGFGTGMAWLLTAAWAETCRVPLHYTALENRLLPAEILGSLQLPETIRAAQARGLIDSQLDHVESLSETWLAARASYVAPSPHATLSMKIGSYTTLEIVLGDAAAYPSAPVEPFDAVYFDAFSPSTNPQLWTADVFRRMHSVMRFDAKLVSYCVNGAVRRSLSEAGFQVHRVPGPVGGKREVLVAVKAQPHAE
ncbi:MAG: tRNA (5-methylaminomethyl-2-thiouridine)(34)-methyltransferase MnmD [Pirellulales bacterium]